MTTMRESCKPKPKTTAPWAVMDESGPYSPVTTYGSAYVKPIGWVPPSPIRPSPQHPWSNNAKFDTRSTSQDSFTGMYAQPVQSFKPHREYDGGTPWPNKPATTNMGAIPHYGVAKRDPHRPAPKPIDGSKFDTRSTNQDAFCAWPSNYRPRPAIYPNQQKYEYIKFDHTSTARAAYVAHQVQPYVPAEKPKPTLGADAAEFGL